MNTHMDTLTQTDSLKVDEAKFQKLHLMYCMHAKLTRCQISNTAGSIETNHEILRKFWVVLCWSEWGFFFLAHLLVTRKLLYPLIKNQKFDCLETNSKSLLNSTGVQHGFLQIPDFMYKH